MKAIGLLIGVGMLSLAASQADATIILTLSQTGFADQSYNLGSSGGISNVTYGDFTVSASASGSSGGSSPNLFTQSLDVSTLKAATLTVNFLQSGMSDFNGKVTSSFTANGSNIASIVESTYLNNQQLASFTYGSNNLGSNYTDVDAVKATGAYTDAAKYVIQTAGSGGTANSTINIQSAVPEPANWAMMLVGFGLIGATLRQRRTAGVSFG